MKMNPCEAIHPRQMPQPCQEKTRWFAQGFHQPKTRREISAATIDAFKLWSDINPLTTFYQHTVSVLVIFAIYLLRSYCKNFHREHSKDCISAAKLSLSTCYWPSVRSWWLDIGRVLFLPFYDEVEVHKNVLRTYLFLSTENAKLMVRAPISWLDKCRKYNHFVTFVFVGFCCRKYF